MTQDQKIQSAIDRASNQSWADFCSTFNPPKGLKLDCGAYLNGKIIGISLKAKQGPDVYVNTEAKQIGQ